MTDAARYAAGRRALALRVGVAVADAVERALAGGNAPLLASLVLLVDTPATRAAAAAARALVRGDADTLPPPPDDEPPDAA